MVNLEAMAALKEAVYVDDIKTGTTINVLVYKAFVGEPFYPTIAPLTKSKAPFFECAHFDKRMVAPEPPYYSTNFNTLVRLANQIVPNTLIGMDQITDGFCVSLTKPEKDAVIKPDKDKNTVASLHADMHVAGLRALIWAVEEGWHVPKA